MTRLLMVNAVGSMGGAEWSLLELAIGLRDQGLSPQIALPPGALTQSLEQAGFVCHPIPAARLHRPRSFRSLRCEWRRWRDARNALQKLVAALRPDCIHANGAPAALLSGRWFAAPDGVIRLWHCRDLTRNRFPARLCARGQDRSIATSEAVRDRLAACLPPRQAGRIVLIPNGIDLPGHAPSGDRQTLRARLGWPRQAPIICMVAHLTPWKRHDRFLNCLSRVRQRFPDALGVIAGSDPYGEHSAWIETLHAQASQLGIDKQVIWLNQFPAAPPRPSPDDTRHQPLAATPVPDILGASDLLLHPAEDEPFGRVICEAMTAGCPVVAMRSAGPATILEHERTGWLCAPGRDGDVIPALSEAVMHLLENEPLRLLLSRAARQTVAQRYDIRQTASRVMALYDSLG